MEALNVMETDEVLIELRDEGSPGVIKPPSVAAPFNHVCIIMPMRI
jgi:DNA polymerase III sliding clamp (beta) subunit (PCNA family)